MRERPRLFGHIALILLAVATSFPLQVMLSYGYQPNEFSQAIAGLAPMNWIVMAMALVHAAVVFRASPWIKLTAPLFLSVVFWNNWLVAEAGLNESTEIVLFATISVIAVHVPLLKMECRRVLHEPKLRWWLTPQRKKVAIQAVIRPVLGGEIGAKTLDLSVGGAFIETSEATYAPTPGHNPEQDLTVGQRCSIRLLINQSHALNCSAEVVRQVKCSASHPGGFAVRFVALDPIQKRLLNACVNYELNQVTAA